MKFAVKRLRRSDLTFFEYQFRRQNAGNQKSINLNRDVFIDVLFPNAPDIAARNGSGGIPAPFHLRLTIYGPGERSTPHIVTRSVLPKTETQKNWRLNGEFVRDPDDDPSRYHSLQADDVALFAFEGDAYPTAIWMVLLSQSEASDQKLRDLVLAAIGGKRMGTIGQSALSVIAAEASANHPIRELLDVDLDEALEEAAFGSAAGIRRVLTSGSRRRMSAKALQDARQKAEAIGRAGEILLHDWLQAEMAAGRIKSVTWASEINAINPWDFEIENLAGEQTRIEVKTTSGPFERPFHISQAELLSAADPSAPSTDLFRIFELRDGTAALRISKDIRGFARDIISVTSTLGDGVTPDGYTIEPDRIGTWSATERIAAPDQDDE